MVGSSRLLRGLVVLSTCALFGGACSGTESSGRPNNNNNVNGQSGGGGGVNSGVGGSGVTDPGAGGTGNPGVGGTGTPGAGGTGTPGAGGTGTAGTGGTGCMPVTSRCDCVVKSDGITPLIDNFEDGDLRINVVDNRDGEWFQSKTAAGANLGTMRVDDGGAQGSAKALHTFGPQPSQTEWPTFGVPLGMCFDASPFTGIRFWIKGSANLNQIRFTLATPATTPTADGGTCVGTNTAGNECYAHFGADVVITNTWTLVERTWAQLLQPANWGQKAPAGYQKEKYILGINFAPLFNTGSYDFWIDDIEFMRGNSRSCADIISSSQFNSLFPKRNSLYTYEGFAAAARQWPAFCTEGDATHQKRDAAALFAHFVQETGSPPTDPTAALVHTNELSPPNAYCCPTNGACPAGTNYGCPGGSYHGRGPMQLSWNYNYAVAGAALGLSFLQNPSLVLASSANAFNAALWFWMTRQPEFSPHNMILNDRGFGVTIKLVNGPLECGGGSPAAVQNRVRAYQHVCQQLGVDVGPGTIDC